MRLKAHWQRDWLGAGHTCLIWFRCKCICFHRPGTKDCVVQRLGCRWPASLLEPDRISQVDSLTNHSSKEARVFQHFHWQPSWLGLREETIIVLQHKNGAKDLAGTPWEYSRDATMPYLQSNWQHWLSIMDRLPAASWPVHHHLVLPHYWPDQEKRNPRGVLSIKVLEICNAKRENNQLVSKKSTSKVVLEEVKRVNLWPTTQIIIDILVYIYNSFVHLCPPIRHQTLLCCAES